VPYNDIVRGVEFQEGYYVILNEDDFRRADPEKSRLIRISHFLDKNEIDPIYYEKPYYLEPANDAGKAFALLVKALQKTDKIGFGQFVLRNREFLATIKPQGKILILNEVRFSEEIIDSSSLRFQEKADFSGQELEIAEDLIRQMEAPFNIKDFKDTYSKKINKLIEEKAAGKVPAEKIEEGNVSETIDLMEKLKQSLQAAKQNKNNL